MIAAFVPAAWGLVGAFCYAGPRFVSCVTHARDDGHGWGLCALDCIVGMIVGAAAASALSSIALTLIHIRDHNAAAAIVGWAANQKSAVRLLGVLTGASPKAVTKDETP